MRAGFCKTFVPKWSRLDHAARSFGLTVTLLRRPAKREAQAGRADFGMCLISPPTSCGWEKTAVAGAAAVDIDDAMTVVEMETAMTEDAVVAIGAVSGDVVEVGSCEVALDGGADSGGLSEPGHGCDRGPWRCTVPSLLWSWRTAWHELHTPLDLRAS